MLEYLVVLPIEAMQTGSAYGSGESLPLHCTLMQKFSLGEGLTSVHLEAELALLCGEVRRGYIELSSDKPALFGPTNDVPVYTLLRDSELDLLHTRLLKSLFEHGCAVKHMHWVGAGFRPHVTSVNGRTFPPFSRYRSEHLVLVECSEDGKKVVIQKHRFGSDM